MLLRWRYKMCCVSWFKYDRSQSPLGKVHFTHPGLLKSRNSWCCSCKSLACLNWIISNCDVIAWKLLISLASLAWMAAFFKSSTRSPSCRSSSAIRSKRSWKKTNPYKKRQILGQEKKDRNDHKSIIYMTWNFFFILPFLKSSMPLWRRQSGWRKRSNSITQFRIKNTSFLSSMLQKCACGQRTKMYQSLQ